MTHGTEDFGNRKQLIDVYSIQDLGELAVRLGSPVVYQRLGTVVYIEDFSNGLGRWNFGYINSGFESLETKYFLSKGFSLKLGSGATNNSTVEAVSQFQPFSLDKVGLEVSFSLESGLGEIIFQILYYTETTGYIGAVKYDPGITNKLYYLNSSGVYTAFSDELLLELYEKFFHTCKLVVDFGSNQYVRFYLDNFSYSLGLLDLKHDTTSTRRMFVIDIQVNNKTSGAMTGYIDNVIVTINEP